MAQLLYILCQKKLGCTLTLHHIYKTNPKMIKELNVKAKIKLLKEYKIVNPWDLALGDDF